jgi:hypothetical protein
MIAGPKNVFQAFLDCRRRHREQRLKRKLMSALNKLQSSVSNLQTVSAQVVTVLGQPNPADPQIQAAADAIDTVAANLTAALPVTPSPAPAS